MVQDSRRVPSCMLRVAADHCLPCRCRNACYRRAAQRKYEASGDYFQA